MKKSSIQKIKGFTILEIAVVIAIFSLVMAAAVPAFEEFNDKADEHSFMSQCKNIKATASVMAKEDYQLRGENSSVLSSKLSGRFEGYSVKAYARNGKLLQMEVVRDSDNKTAYYTDEQQFVSDKPAGFNIDYLISEPEVTEAYLSESLLRVPMQTTDTPAVTTLPYTTAKVTTITVPETTVAETSEATTSAETTIVETSAATTAAETTVAETSAATTVPETMVVETSEASTITEITDSSKITNSKSMISVNSEDLNYDTWIDISKYGNPKLLEGFSIEFEKSNNVARTTFYLGGYNPYSDTRTEITGYNFYDTEGLKAEFNVDQTDFETAPRYIKFHEWNEQTECRKITAVNFRFRSEPQFTPQSGSVKLDVKDISAYGNIKFEADLSAIEDKNFKSVTVEFEDYGYKRNGQVDIAGGQSGSFNMKYPDGKTITVPASAGEYSDSLTVSLYCCPDPTDTKKIKNVYLNYDEFTVPVVPETTAVSKAAPETVPVTAAPVTTEAAAVSETAASTSADTVTNGESNESAEGKDFEYDTWIDISQYGDPKLLEWFSIEFEKSGEYSSISVLLQGYNPHSDNKVWVTGYSLNGSKETSAEFNVDQTEFETAPRYMMITEYNKDYGRGDITGIKFRFKSAPQFTPQNSSVKLDVKDTMVWGNAYYEADFSGVADKNFKSVTIEFENIGYKRTGTVSFTGDQKYSYYMKYSDGKAITVPVTPAGEIIDISVASHSDMNDTAVIKHIYLNYDN